MPETQRIPIVAATGLVRSHGARGGLARRAGRGEHAVRGVSIEVFPGEICGLVGHSGAGKSTLARLLALLERPDSGEIRYDGERVDHVRSAALRPLRRTVQIVFQDPGTALDPLQRIRTIVEEPLVVHRLHAGAARRGRVGELLTAVGLAADDEFLDRYPRELSGGERQRVAIARALACEPRALILDEPVSALDVSIRGHVLNVLVDLRERLGLAILLIAHDLGLVSEISDRVAVMLAGRIVESGPAEAVLGAPLHPHTRLLVEASLGGELDAVARTASGDSGVVAGAMAPCPFLNACGRATGACRLEPELREHHHDHWVACYFPGDP
jgi:oligopeptide/dipeptide ABC transporter ATP-binding protein